MTSPQGLEDFELRDYLQRVVGEHGYTEITRVTRYESWSQLPLDPAMMGGAYPLGPAVLIHMRDRISPDLAPGQETAIAFGEPLTPGIIAARLAEALLHARGAK